MVTRIVNQNVYAAEFEVCFFQKVGTGICIGDVHREDLYASFSSRCSATASRLRLVRAASTRFAPAWPNAFAVAAPHSFRAAGNDDCLVLEVHRGSLQKAPKERFPLYSIERSIRTRGIPIRPHWLRSLSRPLRIDLECPKKGQFALAVQSRNQDWCKLIFGAINVGPR